MTRKGWLRALPGQPHVMKLRQLKDIQGSALISQFGIAEGIHMPGWCLVELDR